jgi:lipopolysaccharide/colanic/teichoic acid biosynthesis glycosyltransferase
MLIIALAVRHRLGSPVLFRAVRAGHGGRPFTLYKFRTMLDLRAPDGALLPDEDRITGLGRFLRRSSLDELPQLVNVLRGEMSLVGPRPLLLDYLDRYTAEQARRHEVLPGITGWAQIHGRNTLSWGERFALDVWYVDHASLSLDLKILARTVRKVIRRADVSMEGDLSVPSFMGTEEESSAEAGSQR